jgi:hypothetical protein
MEVDGIFTDYPAILREVLIERGHLLSEKGSTRRKSTEIA